MSFLQGQSFGVISPLIRGPSSWGVSAPSCRGSAVEPPLGPSMPRGGGAEPGLTGLCLWEEGPLGGGHTGAGLITVGRLGRVWGVLP